MAPPGKSVRGKAADPRDELPQAEELDEATGLV